MNNVRQANGDVSPELKFQITLPAEARRALGLQAGQVLEVRVKKGRIELVPQKSVRALVGLLKGASSTVDRDDDRY